MLLMELQRIAKSMGERLLFRTEVLQIHTGDKIGLIGRNGSGKSTLIDILAGRLSADEGYVKRSCSFSRIGQLDSGHAREFSLGVESKETMSGGEIARRRIVSAFGEASPLLLADEPSANLDIDGAEWLQAELCGFHGALILVTHDRQLLDAVCNAIWEIDDGTVKAFPGNYSHFLVQKEQEAKRRQREYEGYVREKRHLEEAILDRRSRSASTRKTPARMGNSEARLHKMGDQKAKRQLDQAVKAMEARKEKLQVKERPQNFRPVQYDFAQTGDLTGKEVVRGEGITKRMGRREIFADAGFLLLRGQKTALIGPNGCGKTTLLQMILRREAGIQVSIQAKIGYFSQKLDGLDLDRTILANVMTGSVYDEGAVRLLLARLLFRREDVFKPVRVLSGGERVRVALAGIMAGDYNLLFLDEPTNYLDLPSLQALEEVLADYPKTLLFVSHDRRFIDRVATHLLVIESGKIRAFEGNYSQYTAGLKEQAQETEKEQRLLQEHRLSELLSRISVAKDKKELAGLEAEYRRMLAQSKL